MRVFNILLGFILLNCGGFAEIEVLKGWHDSVEIAQKSAEERACPLLVAFLGPNWCDFSDTLEQEVLSQKTFVDTASQSVVLVKIDIPEDFDERDFYGKELKEKFSVDECPSLVIVNQKMEAIAKLSYLPVTCEHFVGYVKQILQDYDRVSHLAKDELKQLKVDELKHLYTRAGGFADATFKKALMKQGLKVDRGPYFLVEEYESMLVSGVSSQRKLKRIRNKVLARDPNNELGCIRKLAVIDFEMRPHSKTPQQVIAPLVSYLKRFGEKDVENAWKLEMKIAQYLFSNHQIQEALKHAKLSYEAAPNESKEEIGKSIDYLESLAQ